MVQSVSAAYLFVRPIFNLLSLFSLTVVLFGCQTVRVPAASEFTGGASVESFSSSASFSYTASGQSISGSGVLMFRKPDQLRAVILSPFGSVLQEVYISGDLVTIVDAGNGTALSGSYRDLPAKGTLSGWRNIHWVIDMNPPETSRLTGVIKRTNRYGHQEKAVFENGLLLSKSTAENGDVRYGRYTTVKGVAFPLEIVYDTVEKEKFTILFEDPEINGSFADGAFTSNISKLRVYPLSSLR